MTEPWSWAMLLFTSPVAGIIKSLPFEFTRNLSIYPLFFIAALLSSLVFFPIYFGLTKIIPRFDTLTRASDKSRARFNRYFGRWGYPGLGILVVIPGPGTGAIVVSTIASALRLKLWQSYCAILAGCVGHGGILAGIYSGVFRM
ncbi:MAG: small multi-drug export protein [Dehalococcoidales bacterium]|nr:small multi-drug export protein [Dehalococcoidales bacterium]